jgi:SAM-dependent methyltransferase
VELSELGLTGERTLPGVPEENYWFRRHEAAYRFAARIASGVVLDVGAGEGYGASMLAGSARVIGVELDAVAARHAGARYPEVAVVRADACRLPFRGKRFDAIVAMQFLEHLWCPERFVEQVRRLLTAGGAFVVTTPNRTTFSPDGVLNPFHTHEYTAEELGAVLGGSFGRVEVRGIHPGIYLRSVDVLAAGSLQRLLMRTPFEELPSKLKIAIGLVRADHFTVGDAEESLDLVAVAS